MSTFTNKSNFCTYFPFHYTVKALALALVLAFVNLASAQTTHLWNPTVGGPNFPWNDRLNWLDPGTGAAPASAPGATSIVEFNSGSSTCILPSCVFPLCIPPGTTSIQGLIISGFTGTINLNTRLLIVNAIGPTSLSSATMSNGTLRVNAAGFDVNVSSMTMPTLAVNSGDIINLSNSTFNGSVTINKTGNTNVNIKGGNTYRSLATFNNSSAGDLNFPTINPDNFDGNLTITTGSTGLIRPAYAADCILKGNLTVNGTTPVPQFGSAAVEFAGNVAQTVNIGGSVSKLSFSKIVLNKSAVEAVTMNTNVEVTGSTTMTNGIIAMGNNRITLNDPASISGFGSTSFIDGWIEFLSASGAVTFPTGDAVGKFYRPVTITFDVLEPGLSNISARYFKSASPSSTSVASPITNVSEFEYWSVNAVPSLDYTATLSWKNVDAANPNYVTDGTSGPTSTLRVSHFSAGQWQDKGNSSVNSFGPFLPLSPPDAGTITSGSINAGGLNIGNLTLGSTDQLVNQLCKGKFIWRPTGAAPYLWNNAANWLNGAVPTASDIAVFDPVFDPVGTTCVLTGPVTVGALEVSFTGSIHLNFNSLTVNSNAPTFFTAGSIIGGGNFVINGGVFTIDISGVTTDATTLTTLSGNAITVGTSVFNGPVLCAGPSVIDLTGNVTAGRFTFSSANLDLNGYSLTINGNGVTNTFTNGTVSNSGALSSISITNTTSGGVTINGTDFQSNVDLTVNLINTTSISILGGAKFAGTLDVTSPDIFLNSSTFNVSSFTKTSGTPNSSNGGNVFNGDTELINAGPATWTMSATTQDTFNQDLTLTEANPNTMAGCTNCKLAGNLTMNRVPALGIPFNVGTIEFIGSSYQEIRRNGTGYLEPLVGIVLNKTGAATVRSFLGLIITPNITFINGILAGDVSLGGYTGGSSVSYIDGGWVWSTGPGPFTFPVGNAGSYRPITISPDALGFGVAYIKSTPPNVTSVSGASNVSLCEYWDLIYGDSTPNFSLTLSWVSAECSNPATNYVSNLTDLRVMYMNNNGGTTWTDRGNTARTGTIAAGTVTSNVMNFNTCNGCYWNGLFTLGSETGINPLPIELSEFSGRITDEEHVMLAWETASEINNHFFEIQRSKDGQQFTTIGEVEGHGTSKEPHRYSFIDQNPFAGWSYYRLKQTDFDGKFTYSDPISIHTTNESKFFVYPVPSREKLFLSEETDVKVSDQMGNVLLMEYGVDEISLEGFKPGVYFLRIPSGVVRRFVVR